MSRRWSKRLERIETAVATATAEDVASLPAKERAARVARVLLGVQERIGKPPSPRLQAVAAGELSEEEAEGFLRHCREMMDRQREREAAGPPGHSDPEDDGGGPDVDKC
jgi:hypothetical protein